MFLDLLLPAACAACGCTSRTPLCRGCALKAEPLVLADRGLARLAPGVAAAGLFAYDGVVREAVRGLKLAGRHGWAPVFGQLLRVRLNLPPDLPVTWVPAKASRRRSRGFDLPELLADGAAAGASRRLLRRVADRPDQTALDHLTRRRSPAGSFAACPPVPPALVLIDDVRTTGATAAAAAVTLLAAGARRVLVVTLAVAGARPHVPSAVAGAPPHIPRAVPEPVPQPAAQHD